MPVEKRAGSSGDRWSYLKVRFPAVEKQPCPRRDRRADRLYDGQGWPAGPCSRRMLAARKMMMRHIIVLVRRNLILVAGEVAGALSRHRNGDISFGARGAARPNEEDERDCAEQMSPAMHWPSDVAIVLGDAIPTDLDRRSVLRTQSPS